VAQIVAGGRHAGGEKGWPPDILRLATPKASAWMISSAALCDRT
jgi:hypothetical protein